MVDSTTVVSLSSAELLKARIVQLQEALQKQLPGYESLLHTIHTNLQQSPDTVHLLEDEEIGVIVAGLQKRTNTFIAVKEANKTVKKGKVALDDL